MWIPWVVDDPLRNLGRATMLQIDRTFSLHKLDAGHVRLMTIAHTFNYRVAVLCDGRPSLVKSERAEKWSQNIQ